MHYFVFSIWFIDQAWGQDGCMLAEFFSFFFYVFMDRDGIEVHKLAKKENKAKIQPALPNKVGQ